MEELRAEHNLMESLLTAREIIQLMDEMPGGLLIYRADGNEEILYANKALLRIFLCETMEEFRDLTGNSFRGLVYQEDLEEVEKSIQAQIRENQHDMDYVEYRIVRKDGMIRWIEDYGHFVHLPSVGDIFYVFAGDATERKEQQILQNLELLEKEEKIQRLIQQFNNERNLINQEHLQRLEVIEGLGVNYESILYADLDTNRIIPYRLSCRTEMQFEKRFQEREFLWYISDYIQMWVHPDDRSLVRAATSPEAIRRRLKENKAYSINYRILFRGEMQYLQLRIVNVGQSGHISQIVMGYRRIDKEFRREMEQKQLLKDALKNANLAITAKNTFLSNMSHDMRTPLNAILGFALLAKKHLDDHGPVWNYVDKIESSGQQLLDLINKVLEISWTKANHIQISENKFNLCSLMEDMKENLLSQTSSKNIALFLDTEHVIHSTVWGDSDKLRQILWHLMNNAVTYTPNGGSIHLSVTEEETPAKGYGLYQFVVQDTGIGISKEFLEHIFEPFEREKNTTMSGVHGMGLGLAIAKNMVETMGGQIKADSAPHKGSTFTVTLQLPTAKQPTQSPVKAIDLAALLSDQKILLVEDNEINLEIATDLLEELGFHIETAENGQIALEKISKSKPGEFALILMDIQMPVMDGRQAAIAIRQLESPALASLPIVALSADAFESDRKKSIECGMDAHLPKPIEVTLLLETIIKAIQNYRTKFRMSSLADKI